MRVVQLVLFKCTLLLLAVVAEGAPSFRIETLGLNDEEHARSDGSINSSSSGMTETGQSYGTSLRLGSSGTGQSAWHFNGSETVKIGFTGPGYESSAGYKYSNTVGMNQLGQVIGTSYRYNGQSLNGHSVWIYDGENTIRR